MSGKLKAAVVGCGGISNWHFSRVKNFEDVEYVGFYDIIKARAEKMAAAKGEGKAFDCYISMLDESKPDILYVCVPPDQHGMIELEAIKRGIHMMIQKPIATDINVAEKICDMATQHNIIISVGHQDRYLNIIDPMKEFLKDRQIGLINGAWVGGIPMVYWWVRKSTSGGQIVEQNIHLYDMLRYFNGEPVTVYCTGGKGIVNPNVLPLRGYDVEDYTAAKTILDAELRRLVQVCTTLSAETSKIATKKSADGERKKIAEIVSAERTLTRTLVDLLIDKVYVYPTNHIEVVWKIAEFYK